MAASFRNEDGTWNDSSVSFNSDSSSESSLHSPPLKKHKRNTNTKSKTILSTNTNTNNTVNTVNTAAQSPWAFATRNERSVKLTRAARSKIPPKQKKKKRKQIKTKKKSKKKSKPNKDQAARAIPISRASKPRTAKPQTKKAHGKAANEFKYETKAEKWLANIKNKQYYNGKYVNCPLESTRGHRTSASCSKNYHCSLCQASFKATQERDMVSHLMSKKHLMNKTAKAKQPKFRTYVALCRKTMFDWCMDAFKHNVSARAMCGIANGFISEHCAPKIKNNIAKNEAQFSAEGDFMNACMDKRVEHEMDANSHRHWNFLCDEGEGNKLGVMMCHTAFNGSDKPLLTTAKVMESSSNSNAVTLSFMANLMRWKLNVNRGRLFFCDGVAYNRTSFTGVMCLCPFMHMIICPLHCGCNSQAEVMESDEGGKILARVYREGTKLFKNSRARVKAWKNYRLSKEQAIDDPKVQGLLESVTDEEFKSLYGESRNDVESRIDDQVERKDNEARIDDEDTNLTNTELSNRSVEALVNVNGEPIKYIKNKWKIHIFLAYYWSIVFLDMISWCHSYFHREWYFTQLSDETVVMISCLLLFWWYLLRPWIQVILTFEKRKPAHHKAYNLITGYFTHVKNAKIDLDADDEDEIDWTLKHNQILKNKPAKVQKMCVKMCNKMVATYHKALLKRYDLNKDPMKYWSCCRFLDPEYKSDCLDIFEAFKHIKFGPAMYENNPNKIDSFRKGFVHFRTVICKLDVDISHGAYLGIDFEFVRKNQTMTGELALARYKMEGDIVTLFETLNELFAYDTFGDFAIECLDNPNANPDSERCVSSLSWITGNKLMNRMETPMLLARLRAAWNKDLYGDMSMVDFN
eukprot:152879_1